MYKIIDFLEKVFILLTTRAHMWQYKNREVNKWQLERKEKREFKQRLRREKKALKT